MTRDVPREEWSTELRRFSRRNAGRHALLELFDPALGAQPEEVGPVLVGLDYDRRDDRVEVLLDDVSPSAHRAHVVTRPRAIDVLTDDAGTDRALRIRAWDDRQMLLRFER